MHTRVLTAQQVRYVVTYHGEGKSLNEKVAFIAEKTQSSRKTLYNYMSQGANYGALNVLLCQLDDAILKDASCELNESD